MYFGLVFFFFLNQVFFILSPLPLCKPRRRIDVAPSLKGMDICHKVYSSTASPKEPVGFQWKLFVDGKCQANIKWAFSHQLSGTKVSIDPEITKGKHCQVFSSGWSICFSYKSLPVSFCKKNGFSRSWAISSSENSIILAFFFSGGENKLWISYAILVGKSMFSVCPVHQFYHFTHFLAYCNDTNFKHV